MVDAKHPKNSVLTARGREMAAIIAEQERSGLSAREFARRRGISVSTLSWWRWSLRKHGRLAAASPAVLSTMIPVALVDEHDDVATPGRGLVLRLPDGLEIEVPSGFDAGEVRRLVGALRC